jgi:3-hydroxyisobutyrate dehydrogenase-like beta-hydroxyacid dehydrogenase
MKAGNELLVHDVRREMAAAHLEKGARWAASPRDAAADRELILSSLPGPTEVERVATGADGVIHGAARGAIYADLSTGSPTVMRKLHGVFKERGVHVLDAPVSGGVPGAVHGTLQVMVGGDEAIGKVGYMGSIGAGTIAKLVHNAISLSTRAIVAEAFTLGVKAGVQPEALLEAVRGGSFGQGNILSRVLPNVVFTGDFDTQQFALRLARKDVGLATELAREFDVPMALISLVEQLMVEAVARGWGERDSNASWELQEERAGVKVRASK